MQLEPNQYTPIDLEPIIIPPDDAVELSLYHNRKLGFWKNRYVVSMFNCT